MCLGSYGICHSIVAADDAAPFMYAMSLNQPDARPDPPATERNGDNRPPHRPLLGFTPERKADQSTLTPARLTILAHFRVSSAISCLNSSGEPGRAVPPKSERRMTIF